MSHAPSLTDARLERMTLEHWAALPEDETGEIVDVDPSPVRARRPCSCR
jgi:hypothetical protein